MGGKKGGFNAYVSSWTKNPLENIATGGAVAAYKGIGAATGAKLPTSSSLGIPEVLPGAPKVKGFEMPGNLQEAEMQMIQRQAAIAAGQAPSIAELQYKQALDDQLKAQQSAVASARGASNVGLLQRQAMMQGNQMGLDIGRESAAAKLAEQRGADQMIAAQAAAQRGVALQQNIANQQAAQAQRGQNLSFLGSLGSAGATIAASDENAKTDIKQNKDDASKTISEFMDALKSYTYEYKKGAKQPEGKPNPEGEVKSVMAQDLEKTDLGKQMVTDTPDGKVVDYAQGMAPLLAAIAELNKRTKKLEGK